MATDQNHPMVRAEQVHKAYGHLAVLRGIDLVVQPGEVSVVIGPSGSGKSTFLRCVNHLEKINAGREAGVSLHLRQGTVLIFKKLGLPSPQLLQPLYDT